MCKNLSVERELRLIKALFFLFGLLIMSWVPRFPEVKANTKLEDVAKLINEQVPAVIVEGENGQKQILTRQDIIAS